MSRIQQPIDPTAGKRLQELLDEYGIKQKEFAQAMNFSPEYVNRLIKGRQRITPENAQFFVKQVFTNRDIRWEWLAGLDNCKTFDDYRLKEYHEEKMKINKNFLEWEKREESVQKILSAMAYTIDIRDMAEITEMEKEENREWGDMMRFNKILMAKNQFLDELYSEHGLAELRWQCQKYLLEKSEMDEFRLSLKRKWILENIPERLAELRHAAEVKEKHKYDDMEYCLFDVHDNIVLEFSPQERIDFINQLYDVVTALIQYHITKGKKKGQA